MRNSDSFAERNAQRRAGDMKRSTSQRNWRASLGGRLLKGQRPWGVRWDDGQITSYDRNDMVRYCLAHIDGNTVTQILASNEFDSASDDDMSTVELALKMALGKDILLFLSHDC